MNLKSLRNKIPDYAKDIRINLDNILISEGTPGINTKQREGIILASAYSTKSRHLINEIEDNISSLDGKETLAIKSACAVMYMNNIYYRYIHAAQDSDLNNMPASLRMSVIKDHGIEKINFELYCLAVSAINGCGLCMKSHTKSLVDAGLTKLGIQSCIRIASVINSLNFLEHINYEASYMQVINGLK